MYVIALSKDAEKQYLKLPTAERVKIKRKLSSLEYDPSIGKKLEGDLLGFRSFRAWPYRIIYSISEENQHIRIHQIKHRQGVYK